MKKKEGIVKAKRGKKIPKRSQRRNKKNPDLDLEERIVGAINQTRRAQDFWINQMRENKKIGEDMDKAEDMMRGKGLTVMIGINQITKDNPIMKEYKIGKEKTVVITAG